MNSCDAVFRHNKTSKDQMALQISRAFCIIMSPVERDSS